MGEGSLRHRACVPERGPADATMWRMAATMTAFRIVEWGAPPRLTDAPVPEPGPGEVLVEVAGNGLCHSDVTMAAMPAEIAEALGWSLPFTLGHEVGGRIAAVGDGVTGFAVGEPVALVSPASCGSCRGLPAGSRQRLPARAGRPRLRAGRRPGPLRGRAGGPGRDPARRAGPAGGGPADRRRRHVAPRRGPGRAPAGGRRHRGRGGGRRAGRVRGPAAAGAGAGGAGRRRRHQPGAAGRRARPRRPRGRARPRRGGRAGTAGAVLDLVGIDATIAAGVAAVRPYGSFALVGAAGGTLRRPWFGGLPGTRTCSRSRARPSPT